MTRSAKTAVALPLLLTCLVTTRAAAQGRAETHPTMLSVPAAEPGDVASVDAIIAALYDVISGPVGEPRDWDRFRSLFVPGGRLSPTVRRGEGAVGLYFLSVNDYVARSGDALVRLGFREREIARREERYGSIAHVFSTYESYRGDETEPFARGINSIQLLNDGARWWIVSVYWQGEGPDNPVPERYLPTSGL